MNSLIAGRDAGGGGIMLKGLSHIAIWVTDIDRALDFYLKLPGVVEQFRLSRDDGNPWLIYLKVGPRQFVELFPGSEAVERRSNTGYSHVCFEVDDIHELYRSLLDSGLTPRGEPVMGEDRSLQLWIDDPDGNPIEFHQFTADSLQIVNMPYPEI